MSLFLSGLRNTTGRFAQLSRTTIRLPLATQRLQSFSDEKQAATATDIPVAEATKLGGFAQAFERHSQPAPEAPVEAPKSFAALLRNSKFVDVCIDCASS